MPEQYHPPNVNQPRVLNRWLDVNAQNGPISRTGTYLIVPAFTFTKEPYALCAYAYGMFTCVAAKNFSFINLPDLSDYDFLLVVSFVDADLTIKRYKLNDIDIDIGVDILPYTNQRIAKSFCIEIWSDQSAAILASSLTLQTSPKNAVDYRFGLDSSIATVTEKTDIFAVAGIPGFPLPLTFNVKLF